MLEEVLLTDKREYICTITMSRPEKHNALTPQLLEKLTKTLTSLKEDKDVRVVIIRGAGNKAFSAGFDISMLGQSYQGGEDYLQNALTSIRESPVPVMAMINGFALGGGCEIAVNCDLRIASDNARFGMPQAKLGMMESYQAIQRFLNIVGVAYTKEIFFTGRMIEALRAKEMGLINQVVPGKDLEEVCYGLAREIATNAPLSVRGSKIIVEKCLAYQALPQQVEKEIQEIVTAIFRSEDCKEGMAAFIEKRKPRFTGR